MAVKAMWIPKSERGHQVARFLREQGFDVRNREVLGRYLSSVPCSNQLDDEQLRHIAYCINPEWCEYAERAAFQTADDIRSDPYLDPENADKAERMALAAERAWLY